MCIRVHAREIPVQDMTPHIYHSLAVRQLCKHMLPASIITLERKRIKPIYTDLNLKQPTLGGPNEILCAWPAYSWKTSVRKNCEGKKPDQNISSLIPDAINSSEMGQSIYIFALDPVPLYHSRNHLWTFSVHWRSVVLVSHS